MHLRRFDGVLYFLDLIYFDVFRFWKHTYFWDVIGLLSPE